MNILVAQPDHRLASIPDWVVDFQSFRRWAVSDEFPESGWYSHLGGTLWVETNMEQVWHNQIKGKIGVTLAALAESLDAGEYFFDRMLLTNFEAELSSEPDGMFVAHDAISSGRIILANGANSLEIVGTPEMVLEVVSRTSRRKDRIILPDLYHKAGIKEYWIVEKHGDQMILDLMVWQPDGYVPSPVVDGWVASPVFSKQFRITSSEGRSGIPQYRLDAR
jgi:Uma2 family endonuclease